MGGAPHLGAFENSELDQRLLIAAYFKLKVSDRLAR